VATARFPDSSPRQPAQGTITTLTNRWRQYTINLAGVDLRYVLGGFGWVASALRNSSHTVFYLDDIVYQLNAAAHQRRLNTPHFLTSFVTKPVQPDPFDANTDDDIDFVLRNTAFLYDNSLALLAFLADRQPDSLRRAKLLGDAIVYATQHDRSFTDGRLRSDYAAGDIALAPGWIPNGRVGTVPVPGFTPMFARNSMRFSRTRLIRETTPGRPSRFSPSIAAPVTLTTSQRPRSSQNSLRVSEITAASFRASWRESMLRNRLRQWRGHTRALSTTSMRTLSSALFTR